MRMTVTMVGQRWISFHNDARLHEQSLDWQKIGQLPDLKEDESVTEPIALEGLRECKGKICDLFAEEILGRLPSLTKIGVDGFSLDDSRS